jgi:hypothetical protein
VDSRRRDNDVIEIAERERVGSRYVRRLLRLAFLAPEIVESIAAGDQPPETHRRGLGRANRSPSALDRAGKSRGNPLVGLRSISSSHFGRARRRIDPVVPRARMEPPHLPTETLASSCARIGGKCCSPLPRVTQMRPQARAIPPLRAENPQRPDSVAERNEFELSVPLVLARKRPIPAGFLSPRRNL